MFDKRGNAMRRPIIWVLAIALITVVAIADLTSAAIVVLGATALAFIVRYRGRKITRSILIVSVLGVTLVGLVAALAVPRYVQGSDPLLVANAARNPTAGKHLQGKFDLTGFVVSDNDNATNSVDSQAPSLSTVVATGGTLNPDGTFLYNGVQNALIHAHLAGAQGELLLQNYDQTANQGAGNFSSAFAHAVLATPASRHAYAVAVAGVVNSEHWDGVVVDFENVLPTDQVSFQELLKELSTQLPSSARLAVSVPIDAQGQPVAGYDLAAIAPLVDVVNIMTYDQHDPTGTPGPVTSIPWTKLAVTNALTQVPASKLQIGVAAYGYAWGPSANALGSSFSASQAVAFSKAHHVTPVWDATSGEWNAKLPDGTVLWWADGKSMNAQTQLATSMKLEGAAIWELSIAPPVAPVARNVALLRLPVTMDTTRTIQHVKAKGLVALTFDDGPDPAWTPQILDILANKHVPATFFDIGMNAQAQPALVNREIADGHVVGDHTYSHLDLTQIPYWRAKLEIAAGNWVLHGITGRSPLLFRSPYGASELADANTAAHRDLATALGMSPVGWNVDPLDWMKPGVATITSRVTSATGDNLVVLLHDGGGDRSQTVAALPGIIDGLRAKGYDFVTADQLDGSIANAYQPAPSGPVNIGLALLSIASFRLWVSAHTVVIWLMIILGLLSILRIATTWPLAWKHRRNEQRNSARVARIHEELNQSAPRQTVTLLIPAHNEEATIAKTIRELGNVHGFIDQIVIAVNGSTDNTADVAREIAIQYPQLPVEVREFGPIGKAGALNSCLPESIGEIIIVVDADTVLDPHFLTRTLPHFRNSQVGAVAGNVKVGNRKKLLPRLQSLEYIMSLAIERRAQAQLNVISVVPGAAGAFRRDAVVRAQGWPSRTLTEDTDLTVALLSAGWTVRYEPGAISWTEAPETVSDVLKQRRRWSYGAVQVSAIHAKRIFDQREGKVGLLALPWIFISQVLLPAAAPIVDFFLLWLILNGDWSPAMGMLLLALIAESILAIWALRTDRESLKQLWLLPLARLIWRPLMLIAVSGSLTSWLRGRNVQWKQLHRKNSVQVPTPTSEKSPTS